MKRIKLEVIYHVPDTANEGTFADRLVHHMGTFEDPERSRNAARPHYESCAVFVERKEWSEVK